MKTTCIQIFSILLLTCIGIEVNAQYAHFITSGTIEYERSINMYALMGTEVSADNALSEKFFEAYKRSNPQFHTSSFTLQFTPEASTYKVKEMPSVNTGFFGTVSWLTRSRVYMDFQTDSMLAVRDVYQEDYAYRDSLSKITWKLTNETREVAGFLCRRANGLIQDSIYVVAFYTTDILPQGGPESFSGLPGMILGVALPHEHVTWFATRIEETKPEAILPPTLNKKVEPMDRKSLQSALEKQIGSWGSRGKSIIRTTLL